MELTLSQKVKLKRPSKTFLKGACPLGLQGCYDRLSRPVGTGDVHDFAVCSPLQLECMCSLWHFLKVQLLVL